MTWFWIYMLSCFPVVPAVLLTVREDVERKRNPHKYANSKFGLNWVWGEFGFTQVYCVACLTPLLNLYCWYIMVSIAVMELKK